MAWEPRRIAIHPDFFKPVETAMAARSRLADVRSERDVEAAKAFVEREKNRDHEIMPMEAIAEDLENSGHAKAALVVNALQLAEAAGAAKAAGPSRGVELVSTRNTRAGTPVARRPVNATEAERAAFEEAVAARNKAKRGGKRARSAAREASASGRSIEAVVAGRRMPEARPAPPANPVEAARIAGFGARRLGAASGTEGAYDIYDVPYTKEGQAALRALVDACYGPDAQPWCIVGRRPGEPAWNRYSSQHWDSMGAPDGRDGRVRFAVRRGNGKLVAVETNFAGPGSGLVWNSLGNAQFSDLDAAAEHRGPAQFYGLRKLMVDKGLDPDMVPYDVRQAAGGGETADDVDGFITELGPDDDLGDFLSILATQGE